MMSVAYTLTHLDTGSSKIFQVCAKPFRQAAWRIDMERTEEG